MGLKTPGKRRRLIAFERTAGLLSFLYHDPSRWKRVSPHPHNRGGTQALRNNNLQLG